MLVNAIVAYLHYFSLAIIFGSLCT
ncbi:MAG: hypothetical protein RLZZ29_1048, partial [Cyanobacteriota bacterium]